MSESKLFISSTLISGVKEPDRVRKLLQGTASLEFWQTFDNAEVYQFLAEANNVIRDMIIAEDEFVEGENNSAALDSLGLAEKLLAQDTLSADAAAFAKQNPLFFILSSSVYN